MTENIPLSLSFLIVKEYTKQHICVFISFLNEDRKVLGSNLIVSWATGYSNLERAVSPGDNRDSTLK